nr:hypothetical protein [Pyrinomonadaceae bacterium]
YFQHSIIAHDRIFNEKIPINGWHSGVADEAAFSIARGTSGLYLAGGLAAVEGEKDRHGFSPLFQHSASKMEDAFRIEQKGFYGATTTLDKCGANWIQNYEITYRKIFQSGGAGRLFDWRDKK